MELDLRKLMEKNKDIDNTLSDSDDKDIDLEDTEAAPEEFSSIEDAAEAPTDLEQFDLGEPLDIDEMMSE